jgi:hypothetical protein
VERAGVVGGGGRAAPPASAPDAPGSWLVGWFAEILSVRCGPSRHPGKGCSGRRLRWRRWKGRVNWEVIKGRKGPKKVNRLARLLPQVAEGESSG